MRRGLRLVSAGLVVASAVLVEGCGKKEPPVAGDRVPAAPSLQGIRVALLPAQNVRGLSVEVDPELAFALEERGRSSEWILPGELRRSLATSPGMDLRIDALPVGIFRVGEVERIGDPLYGTLRAVAAVSGAQVMLIPLEVGIDPEGGNGPRVEIRATLIEPRTGRVIWYGAVGGEPASRGEAQALALAADALARALLP